MIWLGTLGSLIWVLMTWLPLIDPGRANYKRFGKSYRVLRGIMVALMVFLSWITVIVSMNSSLNIIVFIKVFMGITLVVIGNFITRIRPNWFTGIKTPWTLSDPVIWKKTHMIGGYLMVAAGISFVISGIFLHGSRGFWIPISVLFGGAVFDIIYSAVLWKKLHSSSFPRE